MSKATYTYLTFQDAPLWTRAKLAVSILLTPLTVLIMGRSIRVSVPAPDITIANPVAKDE